MTVKELREQVYELNFKLALKKIEMDEYEEGIRAIYSDYRGE